MKRLEVISGVIEIVETIIQPIGEYASGMSDKELIEDISIYEARQEYYRYSINEATVAFYESIINEWRKRYGDKHIPRVAYTKKQIYRMYNMEF
jgi:hypothetical protein